MERTECYRPPGGPVFLTLRPPYKELEASSVGRVFEEAIVLAGLGGRGFSAKSFRPTGATAAVENGLDSEMIRKVGRWKDLNVFYAHNVHARTPEQFTDEILQLV